MSSRKISIFIGVIVAIMIPILIINSMLKLSKKINDVNTNSAEFYVVEIRDSTLLVCDEKNKVGLCSVSYENVSIYDKDSKKIVGHDFEEQQLIKINYKEIRESYPAQLGSVSKITVLQKEGDSSGYEKAKKVYDEYMSGLGQGQ